METVTYPLGSLHV